MAWTFWRVAACHLCLAGGISTAHAIVSVMELRTDRVPLENPKTLFVMAAARVSGLVALYIAANVRVHSAPEVYAIRQKIIDTALPQRQWGAVDVEDRDPNPEGMTRVSESWIPAPRLYRVLRHPVP